MIRLFFLLFLCLPPLAAGKVETARYKKEPPYVIGYSNIGLGDVWLVDSIHSLEQKAHDNREKIRRLVIRHADDDTEKQNRDIDELVAMGVDLLMVSAIHAKAADAAVTRAHAAGIPVVMVVRRVESENFTTYVSGPVVELAETMAFWIVERLGGKGNVVILAGGEGASIAERSLAAARRVFGQFPEIRILETAYTRWLPKNGEKEMARLIRKYGDEIDAVWTDSGQQGIGAMWAYEKAGYRPGTIPPITCGTLNGCLGTALRLKIPSINYDFSPAIVGKALEVGLEILEGKPVQHVRVVRSPVYITAGDETESVKAIGTYEEYYMADKPDMALLGHGLGKEYDPATFSVDYPGKERR